MPNKLTWVSGRDMQLHPVLNHDQKEEHPFEKIMKDIILKDDFKKLMKEALNEILNEREEKAVNNKLVKEFDIVIKRREDGKEV